MTERMDDSEMLDMAQKLFEAIDPNILEAQPPVRFSGSTEDFVSGVYAGLSWALSHNETEIMEAITFCINLRLLQRMHNPQFKDLVLRCLEKQRK